MFKGIAGIVLATVVAGTVGISTNTASAQDPVRVVAQALLQFEAEMKWEAVQESWRGDRPGWVSGLQGASNAGAVARGLGALEVAMKWEAVDSSWRTARPGWVSQVGSASSAQQVAQLLLVLEQATTWAAMNDSWRASRPGWVATLQGVANGQPANNGGGGGGLAVGQNVQVLWNGTWYAASVLAFLSDGTVRIHYTGWADSWDENVARDRIR